MDEVQRAIDCYEKLSVSRPGGQWWADNIIDSSKLLKTTNGHANFYNYLADPDHFKFETGIKTLQDLSEQELEDIDSQLHALCVKDQRVRIYENGPDRKIFIDYGDEKQDDEKRDILE